MLRLQPQNKGSWTRGSQLGPLPQAQNYQVGPWGGIRAGSGPGKLVQPSPVFQEEKQHLLH